MARRGRSKQKGQSKRRKSKSKSKRRSKSKSKSKSKYMKDNYEEKPGYKIALKECMARKHGSDDDKEMQCRMELIHDPRFEQLGGRGGR